MEKFQKLSKTEMKGVMGSAIPSWPCTECFPDDDGPLGPDTYGNLYTNYGGLTLADAQASANADCGSPVDPGCLFVVCTDPNTDPPYNCNA